MPSIRKTPSGRWQATATTPAGRRSRTFDRRAQAHDWARETEAAARLLAQAHPRITLTWTPAGLDIHIPEDLLTMEQATELERAIGDALNRERR